MPKKILFVVNHSEFFLSHRLPLARHAIENGFDVHLATSQSAALKDVSQHGIKIHILPLQPGGMNPFKDIQLLFFLIRLYGSIKPEIIHQVTIKPVMYGSLAARWCKVKAVVNAMSGMGYLYISNSLKSRALRSVISFILKLGFNHPNMKMILQNPDDQNLFIESEILKPEAIQIIKGSGVDPEKFLPQAEPSLPYVVMLPTRLLWDKGVGEFVAAAKIVKAKTPNTRFVLIGAADKNNPKVVDDALVQTWVNDGHVEWWGMKDDMPNVLSQAHVVCLPSYREGLPKSLIEAASCARPIVSTDVPGCREIARNGENAILVPARDAPALAEAIEKLLTNPKLRKSMGERGREIVLEEFTLQKVIEQTFAVYRELE